MQQHIVIVGGGLIGPLLALALARGGLSSTIIDRHTLDALKNKQVSGKGYAIALSSRRLLTALDLWQGIADQTHPIRDILVSDGRVSQGARSAFLHFDHQDIGTEPFGSMVEDHVLRPALLEAIENNALITYRGGQTFKSLTQDDAGVTVTTTAGETIKGAVAIGCDGRQSQVAQAVNIKKTTKQYNQFGLVCTIKHTKPHNHTAHEYFLPGGPFAILPLQEHTSTLVWTEKSAMARRIQDARDDVYIRAVQDRMGDVLGDVSLAGPRWSYPLYFSLARDLYRPRVALAGDAAHVIHPIAGQGLNIGIRDVAALSQVLVEASRRGEDIGNTAVLDRYALWRRPEITALSLATDGLNALFSNDIEPVRALRDTGLAVFNKVPFLRKTAMRFAAGLNGDLPVLLQGRVF